MMVVCVCRGDFNRVECVCNLGDKNDLAYESDLNIRFKRRRRFCDLVINRSEIEMWSLFPILKFFLLRYIVLSLSFCIQHRYIYESCYRDFIVFLLKVCYTFL